MAENLPVARRATLPSPEAYTSAPSRGRAAADEVDPRLDEIDLREVLGVLRRRIGLILTIALLTVGVAAWIVHRSQPLYRASGVVRLVDSRRALTGGLGDPMLEKVAGAWTDPLLSQIQVLQSRRVAEHIVKLEPLGLRVKPIGFPAHVLHDLEVARDVEPDTIRLDFSATGVLARTGSADVKVEYRRPIDIAGVQFKVGRHPERSRGTLVIEPHDEAVITTAKGLRGRARKSTDVIDVEFTATDPVVAQRVANAAVRAFQDVNAGSAQQQSRRRRIFIEEQLQQTEQMLADAQHELSGFRSHAEVYASQERLSAEQQALMGLDVRREELNAERRVYRSLLQRLGKLGADDRGGALRSLVASPGVASNPVVSQLFQQLVRYTGARDSLTTGEFARARTNPDVIRLDTLIASTETRLAQAVESQIVSLDARIAALDDLKVRNAARLQELPATQVTEVQLAQKVEGIKRIADQLREEYQKARIAEAVETGQVEVVDLAAYPLEPIGQSTKVKLMLALIVGLMLGGGAAFLAEHLNTAIRRREDIEEALNVPGLAVIPQIGSIRRASRLRIGPLALPGFDGATNGRRNGAHANGKTLVTVSDGQGVAAEAYRTLRTNLIFSQAIQSLRTIVVTSPSPGDGKTTTSANLAVTFAAQGLKVVIVDCDLRKARLHNVFGIAREPGLTQLVLGITPLAAVTHRSKVENLHVIPAGVLPPNPSEMLGGARMRETIAQLATEYDMVILDTPPVHVAADSAILGVVADGVLLVLRAGQSERHLAQDALGRLERVGARVLGAVLNDPDHKVPAYGGYYHYEYSEKG